MPAKSHRRNRGEGTITHRSDGRWQATIQLDGQRRTIYRKTEKEARAALRELRQQVTKPSARLDPGRHTLNDLADTWISSAPGLRETTKASYRQFLTLYAFPTMGCEQLERITPDRLQGLYATLKPSVAEKLHRILHRAFAVAVMWRWLAENPCDRMLRPAYRPAERVLWSETQAKAFVSGVEGHWLAPLFLLLAATGLRLGEALALRWEDTGLGVAVSVSGTLQRLEGEAFVGAPKTASARRTVMLPPLALEALKIQRAQQEEWRRLATDWKDGTFVFTGKTGKPLHRCVPESALKRLCDQLGLPRMSPHGLRHLHASLLIAQAVPLTAVSARLGHANPQITLRLYAHAIPGQDQMAAEAIGRTLSCSPSSSPTLGTK